MFEKIKAIESIKPKQASVEKALTAARQAEGVEKVIEIKKQNKRKFAPLGVVAASLAIIIGLGAVFISNSKAENSFFLVAKAAQSEKGTKLNEKNFSTIGKLDPYGMYFLYSDDFDKNVDDVKLIRVLNSSDFDISCEGTNVDTITYSCNNSLIGINKKSKKLLAYSGKQSYFYDSNGGSYGTDDNNYYKSITIGYDNQLSSRKTAETPELFTVYEVNDNNKKMTWDYINNVGKTVYTTEMSEKKFKNILESYLNDLYKNTVLTVIVKYKDNSTETKKVKFDVDCNIWVKETKKKKSNNNKSISGKKAYAYNVSLKGKVVN